MKSVLIAEGIFGFCFGLLLLWIRHYKPMLRAWASTYGLDLLLRNRLINPKQEAWLREQGYS